MSKIGYARVSTAEQNTALQIQSLIELGCDKIFLDRQSKKNHNREQLQEMFNLIQEGDIVIVTEYSRLARSVKELLSIIEKFRNKKVDIISVKENFDTSTPQGSLILTIFEGLSEFERHIALENQREGIKLAQSKGKYHGRPPLPFDEKAFRKECIKWVDGKQTAVKTMSELNMKPNRFYKKVKELGIIKPKKAAI